MSLPDLKSQGCHWNNGDHDQNDGNNGAPRRARDDSGRPEDGARHTTNTVQKFAIIIITTTTIITE